MRILSLYSGTAKVIGDKRTPTGIYKTAQDAAAVNVLGIVGDVQVDKRFHGGPDKALHQFSLLSYQKIIQRFPLLHRSMKIGSIGENISASHMNEDTVCIGDIYATGSIIIQVTGPRTPCWKIDEKFKQPNLHLFIRQHQLSGWYYRVLQEGNVSSGDEITLVERMNPALTIRYFLRQINTTSKTAEFLTRVKQATQLDTEWQSKLL